MNPDVKNDRPHRLGEASHPNGAESENLPVTRVIELLKRRDSQTPHGLVWEGQNIAPDKTLNRDFVGFKLDATLSCGSAPWRNLAIEGDNYDGHQQSLIPRRGNMADYINFHLAVTEAERNSINFNIDSQGAQSISAAASQTLSPSPGEFFPERIKVAKIWLWIHTPDSIKNNSYFMGRGQRLDETRESSLDICAMAVFNGEDPGGDVIEFTVVVPHERFEPVRRLFELLWLSRNIDNGEKININIKSTRKIQTRFSTPAIHDNLSFAQEFMGGNPILFGNLEIELGRNSPIEEPRLGISHLLPGHAFKFNES